MEEPREGEFKQLAVELMLSIELEHFTRLGSKPFTGSPDKDVAVAAVDHTLQVLERRCGAGSVSREEIESSIRVSWIITLERHGSQQSGKYFSPITSDAGIPLSKTATD